MTNSLTSDERKQRLKMIRYRAENYLTGTVHAETYNQDVNLLLSMVDGKVADYTRPRAADPQPPLCAVHAALDRKDTLVLEVGNGCIACPLHERTQLLNLLEPFAANDGSQDSLTVLRSIINSAAPSVTAPVSTAEHRCPNCGRRMKSDFDEDVGIWYECANCDYREAVSNSPAGPEGEQETGPAASAPVLLKELIDNYVEHRETCPSMDYPSAVCDCGLVQNLEQLTIAVCSAATPPPPASPSDAARKAAAEEIVAELDRRALLHDSNATCPIDADTKARIASVVETVLKERV